MDNQDKEIEFVDPSANNDSKCPVCLGIFHKKTIHKTECCGSHVCLQCATTLKQMSKSCHHGCRTRPLRTTEDNDFSHQILSWEVRCYRSRAGCTWTGELRQLEIHVEKNCTKILVKCCYCNEYLYCSDIEEHMLTCSKANASITCPNRCYNFMQRKGIKAHLENECPLRVIIPPNGALPITANGETSIVPVSFTMLDHLKHLESGQPWYSPPFYTRESGYKLCIRVDAKLNEESRQHYLSAHACILKGDYDDQLCMQWPLHAEMKVSLLLQSGIPKSLYLPGDEYCKQVLVNEITPDPRCNDTVEFISNKELEFIFNKNMVELSCKCLSFRVESVKILPLTTPVIPPWAKHDSVSYFVINSFKRMTREGCNGFYGPSFFTHENHCKVQPHVKVYNEGAGVAVSVSVIVMEENEDKRPFSGELGIELVNWRQNKNHKSITIKFDENNQSHGILKFEEYLELTYNCSTNTKYLHNDCLLFKVVFAVAYSAHCCNIIPQWRQQGTQSNSVFEFTLANRVIQRTFYYSKPFFASGYKMQICVKVNADGYIGVYVHLMKGPNDDQLIWPFCGDVVVELVNWIEDKDHHRQVLELSPEVVTNKACNKVLVGNRNDGSGTGKFIQHSSIRPQFLQDGRLYFRVKEVIVHSNALTLKCPNWQSPESVSPYAEFTVTNISKRKEHDTTFYSPAFHSHNEGYKLRLEVQRSSDQQYIGIYARLLRGQHDDNLVWPFQASIVVELVNWREDANHHSHTITFNERTQIKCKFRVTKGEWAPSGWGTSIFISYSSLCYNSNTNTKYLQDDCLRFRVKEIVVYSTPLCVKKPPWQGPEVNSYTITCFRERIRLQDIYWSPPFYTSARGYRMYLKVYPAGAGTGKGTHVSMYGFLMKGDYDDELNWPFTADVVVDILNWRGDHNHHRVALQFNDTSYCARVYDAGDLAAVGGQGNTMAIEINTLLVNDQSSEKLYLSEDCMCIKIHDIVLYNGCTQLNNKTPYWEGWWNSPSSSQPEFTITGVSQHMKYDTAYISPSFYTHKNYGYKMRLEVYLNGLSNHTGTNVCIYFCLLRGEYDDTLKWPMSIKISVTILNWCKNDAHIQNSCEMRNADKPGNNILRFMGYHPLCTHTHLLATHYKSTQYVQDDCMRIRIDKFTLLFF